MRTTVIINNEKLDQLMAMTGLRKKSEAINAAIDNMLVCLAKRRLLDLAGTLDLQENWQQTRELELEEK
jgi:hypothetical protein